MSDDTPQEQPEEPKEPEPTEPMLEIEPSELSQLAGDAESSDESLLIPTSDYQPEKEVEQRHSIVMVNAITLAVTSVVVLGMIWVLYGRLSGIHNTTGKRAVWSLITLIAALGALNCLMVYRRLRARIPHPSTYTIHVNPRGKRISDRSLDTLRHKFMGEQGHEIEREQVIHLVTRKHWMYAIKCMRLPLGLLAVYLALTAWLATVTNLPSHVPAWLFVVILGALAVWCSTGFLRWYGWYFAITDRYAVIIIQYPVHAWWMQDNTHRVLLSRIDVGKASSQRIFGDLFGYGIAGGDTRSSQDEEFHHLDYMPQYLVINNLLLELHSR